MLDVSDALNLEARYVYRVTESDGDYNASGDWVPGDENLEEITANVQPVSGRKLRSMPEGVRTEAVSIVYTDSDLQIGDIIEVDQVRHRVIAAQLWSAGDYTEAVLGLL